jgi:hypothetical protein
MCRSIAMKSNGEYADQALSWPMALMEDVFQIALRMQPDHIILADLQGQAPLQVDPVIFCMNRLVRELYPSQFWRLFNAVRCSNLLWRIGVMLFARI